MIVVRIELWPHGDGKNRTRIGTASISNIGPPGGVADYEYRLWSAQSHLADELNKHGTITAHYREQNVWRLIQRMLEDAFP